MTTDTISLRIVEDLDIARREVLKRDLLEEPELPESLQASITELWGEPLTAAEHVRRIIADVRREGDAAVRRYTERFDGSSYEAIEVSRDEIGAAFDQVSVEDREAIQFAAERVRRYHEEQLEHAPRSFTARGTGMLVRPLRTAGIYMTGGAAALPSSKTPTSVKIHARRYEVTIASRIGNSENIRTFGASIRL